MYQMYAQLWQFKAYLCLFMRNCTHGFQLECVFGKMQRVFTLVRILSGALSPLFHFYMFCIMYVAHTQFGIMSLLGAIFCGAGAFLGTIFSLYVVYIYFYLSLVVIFGVKSLLNYFSL
jgi:hypothetical protein